MAKSDDGKAERLAAALRENLKRRKAQARDLDTAPESSRRKSGSMTTEGES